MRDVLIQRRQLRPLGGEAKRPEGMTKDDWEELDLLAMSTIRLHLADNVYFTVLDCDSAEMLWTKLCSTYEKETASNKVYLMRKNYDLRMKDNNIVIFLVLSFVCTVHHFLCRKTTTRLLPVALPTIKAPV